MATTVFKRRKNADPDSVESLGLLERIMFSFMGPPEIGQDKPRDGYVPDPAGNIHTKCGRSWDDHERVHTGSMTYRRCPLDQG